MARGQPSTHESCADSLRDRCARMRWSIAIAEGDEPYCVDSPSVRPRARIYSDRFIRHLFSNEYGISRAAALKIRRAHRSLLRARRAHPRTRALHRRYQTAEEFEAWALLWRQIDKFVRACGGQPSVAASTTPKASAIANRIELAVEAIGAAIVVQDRKRSRR